MKLAHRFMMIGALLVLMSCNNGHGSFSLINNAAEPITHALVEICGQTIELRNIQSGNSANSSYSAKFDSHYSIQIEFQSGKKIQNEVGYVTNGMDFRHIITVTDSDIKISESN